MIEDKIMGKYIVHIIATMQLDGEEDKETEDNLSPQDPGIKQILALLWEFSANA